MEAQKEQWESLMMNGLLYTFGYLRRNHKIIEMTDNEKQDLTQILKDQFLLQIKKIQESQVVPEEIFKNSWNSLSISIKYIVKYVITAISEGIPTHNAYHYIDRKVLLSCLQCPGIILRREKNFLNILQNPLMGMLIFLQKCL